MNAFYVWLHILMVEFLPPEILERADGGGSIPSGAILADNYILFSCRRAVDWDL